MKKQLKMACIILMAGLFVLPVTAFSRGGRDGFRPDSSMRMMVPPAQAPVNSLTPEQISRIEKLHKKFRDENADILKQLMTKRFDFDAALDSDSPDIEKAKTVRKDISSIEAKLAQKQLDLYAELLKIDPKAKFHGGMDRGPKMPGMMEMKRMKRIKGM